MDWGLSQSSVASFTWITPKDPVSQMRSHSQEPGVKRSSLSPSFTHLAVGPQTPSLSPLPSLLHRMGPLILKSFPVPGLWSCWSVSLECLHALQTLPGDSLLFNLLFLISLRAHIPRKNHLGVCRPVLLPLQGSVALGHSSQAPALGT